MAAEEQPVYAPDQLRPGSRKWSRIGALGSAVVILMCFWGNHEGRTENVFLIVFALGLVGWVVADSVLRRNGLKANDQ